MLFDMRKAYLRCMYYALIAVAFWPFVPRCKDIVHDGSDRSIEDTRLREEETTQMLQGADECLEAARNYLRVAEEILTQKSLVSHMILRRQVPLSNFKTQRFPYHKSVQCSKLS